jgi:L-threonylcarbamoyladenylate synthase
VESSLTVEDAAAIVARGGVVVIPTETVYGIAATPDDAGVAKIFEVKQRPREKTLQLLIPDRSWLDRLADPSQAATNLADAFWPGPLTLVVPRSGAAPEAVTNEGTIGLRVPAHPVALDLLAITGPLAASSANRSGEATPQTVAGVAELFGSAVDGYLDGDFIDGPGSTVVAFDGDEPRILREGVLSAERIVAACRGVI